MICNFYYWNTNNSQVSLNKLQAVYLLRILKLHEALPIVVWNYDFAIFHHWYLCFKSELSVSIIFQKNITNKTLGISFRVRGSPWGSWGDQWPHDLIASHSWNKEEVIDWKENWK